MNEEWENEQDKFDGEFYGLKVAMRRNSHLGSWCGYVAVPSGHPYFNKGYDDLDDIDVHGGLTFAKDTVYGKDENDLWWLGFDCAHCGDCIPNISVTYGCDQYRNESYVKNECEKLAKQLSEAK